MIKELTYEEAARLRELVKTRFLQSSFNNAGFRVSQYKGSYRHLADDIIRVVPGTEASVTTNRLRKLFFYTDPERAADKLEKPSFGDDFIQVLFKYIEEEPKPVANIPRPRPFSRKWLWRGAALLLLLVSVIAAGWWFDRPKYWEEQFDDVSVRGMESRGWKFFDYDPVAFSRQLRPGFLTLYTYPGDYWVKAYEMPTIKNMLIKKFECSRCMITVRLVGFDPYQNAQQASLYIFGPELDRQNFFRVSSGYNKAPYKCYWAGDKATDQMQGIQSILYRNGRAAESVAVLRFPEIEPQISEVGLLIEITGKRLTLRYWVGEEWSSIREEEKLNFDLPFLPAYLGICAAQGQTDNNGLPLGADTIPAFFDYVKVEPLPE